MQGRGATTYRRARRKWLSAVAEMDPSSITGESPTDTRSTQAHTAPRYLPRYLARYLIWTFMCITGTLLDPHGTPILWDLNDLAGPSLPVRRPTQPASRGAAGAAGAAGPPTVL